MSDAHKLDDNGLGQALRNLSDELDNYIHANITGSGLRGVWPPIDSSHPVHDAVCAVEAYYPHNHLPSDAIFTWHTLVEESRRGGETHEAGYAAHDLSTWANRAAEALNAHPEASGAISKITPPTLKDPVCIPKEAERYNVRSGKLAEKLKNKGVTVVVMGDRKSYCEQADFAKYGEMCVEEMKAASKTKQAKPATHPDNPSQPAATHNATGKARKRLPRMDFGKNS